MFDLHITGNTSTLDEPLGGPQCSRVKPFNREMIRFSEYALQNLKYIKSASINAIKVDENLFDLVVNIQEVPSSFSMEFSEIKLRHLH